jgi:hypothetical protein
LDYKKDLEIDKNNLDGEWEQQSLLFAKWAEKAVEAAFDRDRAKENLDIVRAKLDQKIRLQASTTNEKITETAIANKIILDIEYQEANQQVIESAKNLGILNVARESFDHRKKALERETDLYLAGYYSEPKESKFTKSRREDKEEIDKTEHYRTLDESRITTRRK